MNNRPLSKLLCTLIASIGLSSFSAHGDDTQLFMLSPTATNGRPNVLIVWDNTANWNQPFTTEKTALTQAFNGLDVDIYNVGMMMFTETGGGNSNTDGGYVRAAIRKLTADYRTKLTNMIGSLDILNDKSNGGKYGLTMWEAWQYFNGLAPHAGNSKLKADYLNNPNGTAADQAVHGVTGTIDGGLWNGNALTGFAGSPYQKPQSDGCQKNYVIFISNGPASDNNNDTTAATTALQNAGGDTTAVTISPSGSQTNVADEWARFMANHTVSNRERVYTYTIDVNPGTTGQGPGNSALLKSMANQGKGKYYCFGATQNALGDTCAESLQTVLESILREILAVNSVFASVTLPVNVNVRGRLLNQVYMGVFRPDSDGKALWPGNLKAYKVGATGTNADGTPIFGLLDQLSNAIENTDTSSTSYGFILPSARSFWTHTTTTGFWNATYYPDVQGNGGIQDLPDGELVEKGGAAQRLRDFYSKTSGLGYSINDATNGRKLYTCVSASGATCADSTHLSAMPFSNDNANLTGSVLGLANSVSVTLTRSGNTVTATATGHPFATGDSVTISGANQTQYNGTFIVTKINSDTFTYTIVEQPVTPATGTTIRVTKAGGSAQAISTITRTDYDATTATVTTTAASHGYTAPTQVSITGSSDNAYNGTFTIQSTPTPNTFTISGITASPVTPATNATTSGVQFYSDSSCTSASGGAYSIKTSPSVQLTRALQTVSVTVTANLPNTLPGYVKVTGVTPDAYNTNCTAATKTANRSFTYTLPASKMSPPLVVNNPGMTVDSSSTPYTITSLSRVGSTATAVTSAAHGYAVGNSVTISGADQTNYNGTFTVASVPTTTSFTYTVTLAPASPATGTISATTSSGVSASTLIDWTRGINMQDNDNPNPSTDPAVRTSDVRGYIHGDVLHSRPVVINYNRAGQPLNRDIAVFYGANDGFLHAIKGGLTTAADSTGDGKELWGFIAPEHFGRLGRLYTNVPAVSFNSPKPYFFDGPLSTYTKYAQDTSGPTPEDRLEGANAKAFLYATMRRGGSSLYAFDIKDPTDPIIKWRKSSSTAGFGELGQTWSEAKVAKIKFCSGDGCTDRPVIIFGAGYDPTAEDASPQGTATKGRGIYIVDADTGSLIWMAGPSQPANFPNGAQFLQVTGMTYPIPSDLAVIDRNGDGYVDRIYAPDTGGNIWRVNIDPAGAASTWTVGKLASLRTGAAATGNNYRKFLYPPDVVFGTAYDSILIGSGDREHPFDLSTENRFYMIKDDPSLAASSGTSAGTPITESTASNNMCDVTNNLLPTNLTCTDATVANCQALLSARASAESCLNAAGNHGWFINLCQGEKVVNTAITLAGAVNFGTNVPRGSNCITTTGSNQCAPDAGEARLYFIDYRNGTPLADTNASGTYTASDRYHPGGVGFSPSGTQITTEVCDANGENCKVTDIVCSGSHCLTPPTPSYGRRYRVFWKMDLDN